ncbi:MAG: 30S ribosomal protein S5 [Candidatus Omnitrophica bacterium]|nr:30S ribosomal protein S5 [Candidatus Omnitrophota bacterium]
MRRDDLKTRQNGVFIEKVLFINRVTKVTKGGKNLGFTALVVVGDGKSKIGFASGKANEVVTAIKKGIQRAKRNLTEVKKDKTTIPHEVRGQFGAVEILLKPAARGTGVIAGSIIRAVCECAGINDILTKILRKSTTPINVVKATFCALSKLKGAPNESVSG